LTEPEQTDPADRDAQRLSIDARISAASFHDLDTGPATRAFVRLATPDPFRKSSAELRELWQEGIAALRQPGAKGGHRHVPIGPYRLSVVASIRSRSAGQVAIQGMPNKQIEMLVPPFTTSGSGTKPVLAVWVYANNSLAITYFGHLRNQRYVVWDAATGQQSNFESAADLNHYLYSLGMEAPDQVDRVLTQRYRPHNAV
jgi:serine/threonine-protein kinase